ncbi:NAD-dependent epimerase/dehydratase [Saccharothrix longispora]|uniref:NAD-dependent epimerase/dehydratase family protein n=1 Tax=Saccharothrix longispora TaxID=33920 RepID=UPI0028FD8574|nr:NAD-dependent epimerase/dehydratase [Saccharothrix longispora]MDU0291014.1 NAD-dependent epimerase/dehydratase [Saccharothrix longispora]
MSARAVVLGGTGFIGSAVLHALARDGLAVRAVATRPTPPPPGATAFEAVVLDLTAPGALAGVVADADVVVYALAHRSGSGSWRAADGDTSAERVNTGLVLDLVDVLSARGGPPPVVLYAGTKSQLGDTDQVRIDGSETDRPRTPYGRQKLAAELALTAADADGVLRAVSLRLPTTYGHVPGSGAVDRGVVSAMARRALAGEPITMWHDGTVRRDLLHVADAAEAFRLALRHVDRLAGRHWVIGTGRSAPLGEVFREVAGLVAELTGREPVPVRSVPPPGEVDPGDLESVEFDASAFTAVTGWRPRVRADEGLRDTVARLVADDAAHR